MRLGGLIKSICGRATSMNQAAKKSGTSQATLSEWQAEKVTPRLDTYIDFCLGMGVRPGFELDRFLGLDGAKPRTAEDVLGIALGLDPIEQQRLISLVSGKYSEHLAVNQMIDINCLIDLIRNCGLSPEQFCKKSGVSESEYMTLMHGILPASVEDAESLLSLVAVTLKNPTTGKKFDSRDELINYCKSRKSHHTEQREPNGTSPH